MSKILQTFIFSKNKLPKSKAYEIADGFCGNDLNILPFSTIYLVKGPGNVSIEPEVNDIIYNDVYLTLPYSGAGASYRMGLKKGNIGAILTWNREYYINNNGQIINIVDCSTGGGSTTILGQSDSNCFSCMSIRVEVLSGSKHVSVSKIGIAPYGFGISNCVQGIEVNFDLEEDITETKIYDIALDCSRGNEQTTSSINFQVDSETPIILQRNHNFPLITC